MKTSFFKVIACLCLSAIIFSCSKEEKIEPDLQYITLKLTGELIKVDYSPLTRASSNDLYGISVLKGGQPYASGIVDDASDLSLQLAVDGSVYTIMATIIKDGKTKLFSSNSIYGLPFNAPLGSGIAMNNSFSYAPLKTSTAKLSDGNEYNHPDIERYYGAVTIDNPAQNEVSIEMKRMSFGAEFIATGANATSGTLEISLDGAPALTIPLTENGENTAYRIYTMAGDLSTITENSTETIPVTFNYKAANGENISLGTHNIDFMRNKKTTVTLQINNVSLTNNISLSIADTETGNMEQGNSVTITDEPIANNEIWYTTSDGQPIDHSNIMANCPDYYPPTVISNTYQNGKGVIKISKTITELYMYAFRNKSTLTGVTLPESIEKIGQYAFEGCSGLTEITIPESVTEIGNGAFNGCFNLSQFKGKGASDDGSYLVSGSKFIGWAPKHSSTTCSLPNTITKLGTYAFYRCSNLVSITLPNSITEIGQSCFLCCTNLETINIPGTVTNELYEIFRGCSKLKNVTLNNGITSLGVECFSECTSLEEITIPSSINTISHLAFNRCSNLKNVYCKNTTPPTGGDAMFGSTHSDLKIHVPSGSVSAYKAANYWKDYENKIIAQQ